MTKRNSISAATALALVLALAGCATTRSGDTAKEMNQALDEAAPKKGSEPPAEVSAALLPPLNLNLSGGKAADTEPRFDVRVRGVAARDFFMSLVEGTPYNMVVPNDLTGTITLDLKNVTVPEVMEAVRQSFHYEFDRAERGFSVLPNRVTTRIFYVNYLDLKRAGLSSMAAAPGEVTAMRGNTSTGGTSTQGQSGGSSTTQGSFSRISTESTSDLWAGLGDSLRQMIGGGEGRSVTVNPQSGVIVVRAMPGELRAVGDFLSAIQGMVQRQVILEARILEVELSDGFQAGINWGALRNSAGESAVFGFGNDVSGTATNSAGRGLTSSYNNNTFTSSASQSFTMGLFGKDFTAFIDLLKTQGDVQVLSSPRVSTVNNQKAVIKVGSDEFFVTGVDSSTTTVGTEAVPQVDVELTPFFSGVALDVTPQISREGDIVLHVHPSVSEVTELNKNITAMNSAFTLPTAASTIRESDSVIRARNGQIVVIGGLMQTRQQEVESGVPVLSKIPLLGYAFKHTSMQKRKSELVILLKPVVVDSADVWTDQIERSSKTIRQLGAEQ